MKLRRKIRGIELSWQRYGAQWALGVIETLGSQLRLRDGNDGTKVRKLTI